MPVKKRRERIVSGLARRSLAWDAAQRWRPAGGERTETGTQEVALHADDARRGEGDAAGRAGFRDDATVEGKQRLCRRIAREATGAVLRRRLRQQGAQDLGR